MTDIHHVTPNSGKAPAIRPFGLYRFDIFCADRRLPVVLAGPRRANSLGFRLYVHHTRLCP